MEYNKSTTKGETEAAVSLSLDYYEIIVLTQDPRAVIFLYV